MSKLSDETARELVNCADKLLRCLLQLRKRDPTYHLVYLGATEVIGKAKAELEAGDVTNN